MDSKTIDIKREIVLSLYVNDFVNSKGIIRTVFDRIYSTNFSTAIKKDKLALWSLVGYCFIAPFCFIAGKGNYYVYGLFLLFGIILGYRIDKIYRLLFPLPTKRNVESIDDSFMKEIFYDDSTSSIPAKLDLALDKLSDKKGLPKELILEQASALYDASTAFKKNEIISEGLIFIGWIGFAAVFAVLAALIAPLLLYLPN